MRYEIATLNPADRGVAARLLADAFLHDPAWEAIGPDDPPRRRRLLERYQRVVVGEALRWGGPNWCARVGDAVVGVALTFGDGRRFPSPRATWREAPPFVLAGAAVGVRGARVDTAMKRAHARGPHLYLWFLAARPDTQRRGVGRALMQRVLAEADRRELPVHLDTTRPENIAYYDAFGFRPVDEIDLIRGARLWPMRRERTGPE